MTIEQLPHKQSNFAYPYVDPHTSHSTEVLTILIKRMSMEPRKLERTVHAMKLEVSLFFWSLKKD